VTFDIDANGIMKISAKDKGTGKENKITIKSNSGLSEAEIQQMVQDAEDNAEADKKARELIEARNNAESTLNEFRNDFDKYKDAVTDEERAQTETALKAVEDAIAGDDVTAIQESIPKLYEAIGPITKAKQQAEEAQTKQSQDPNVVDAEVKESAEAV
jgi:molecular chaperone DnaK